MDTHASHLQKIGWNLLMIAMGLLMFFAASVFFPKIEQKLFPVVVDFEVTDITLTERTVFIEGTMKKVRNCTFIAMVPYEKRNGIWYPINVDFANNRVAGNSRPALSQSWGPWRMDRVDEGADVVFFARHRCHPFYESITMLTEFEVKPRSQ